MHLVPDTNVVFLHIPKTAGQAVKLALGIRANTDAHSYQSKRDKQFMGDEYIRFCVVRHPIARFISAYLYNIFHSDAKPTGIRKLLIDLDAKDDINRFVSQIRSNQVDLSQFDHFKRQTRYIKAVCPQIILRQENLSNDIQIIARLLGKSEIEMPFKNTSAERPSLSGINIDLTPENKTYITKRYAPDFNLLGYRLK